MSGVFGIADPKCRPQMQALERMQASLRLFSWTRVQTWEDNAQGIGLGQVNIGKFSSDTQPVHSVDQDVQVVFFGELYNQDSLSTAWQVDPSDLEQASDCALVLAGYLRKGAECIRDLDGVFVLAIWDRRSQCAYVANDRFGLLPIYYLQVDDKFVFAPEVKALFAHAEVPKRIDVDALAQYMRFQRVLGDRTFFEDVKFLPPASLLRFDLGSGQLHLSRYWTFAEIHPQPAALDFSTAVHETGRLLRQALEKRLNGEHSLGVYLSGGLDSRTVIGFASKIRPMKSVTYGLTNSRDACYAERIARRVGSEHHFVAQDDGRWVLDELDTHLEITEGFTTWIHGHAGSTLLPAREWLDVGLTGYFGDGLIGARATDIAKRIGESVDEADFLQQYFLHMNQDFCWPGITEAEEKLLFTSEYYAQIRDRAFVSLREYLKQYRGLPFPLRLDSLASNDQSTRHSNMNLVYQRPYFEVRYPFKDYALVDFVLGLPHSYRKKDRLYYALINEFIPEVTWIPRERDQLLLTDIRGVRQAHGMMRRIRARFDKNPLFTLHNDPEGWLRNDLQDWARELLFDPCTLERGIFNPDFIRSIFKRHMSGLEVHTIGKIAPIMTYEMMLRRFFD